MSNQIFSNNTRRYDDYRKIEVQIDSSAGALNDNAWHVLNTINLTPIKHEFPSTIVNTGVILAFSCKIFVEAYIQYGGTPADPVAVNTDVRGLAITLNGGVANPFGQNMFSPIDQQKTTIFTAWKLDVAAGDEIGIAYRNLNADTATNPTRIDDGRILITVLE